jgi:hypothetical protein
MNISAAQCMIVSECRRCDSCPDLIGFRTSDGLPVRQVAGRAQFGRHERVGDCAGGRSLTITYAAHGRCAPTRCAGAIRSHLDYLKPPVRFRYRYSCQMRKTIRTSKAVKRISATECVKLYRYNWYPMNATRKTMADG